MRKPQRNIVHEDFQIKRNAEITLLGDRLFEQFFAHVRYVAALDHFHVPDAVSALELFRVGRYE